MNSASATPKVEASGDNVSEHCETFLLRKHGTKGIAGALVVLAVVIVLIFLSKLNEVRQYRVPMVWRKRVRRMIEASAKQLKMAQDANHPSIAYHHALEAETTLRAVKNLVGEADLSSLTNYHIGNLESEIDNVLSTNIPEEFHAMAKNNNIKGGVDLKTPIAGKGQTKIVQPATGRGRNTAFALREHVRKLSPIKEDDEE